MMTTQALPVPQKATSITIRKKVGQREHDVDEAHERVVDPAAEVAGDGADGDADQDDDR